MLQLSVKDLKEKIHVLNNIVDSADYEDLEGSLVYQLNRSNFTSDRTHFIKGNGKSFQVLMNGQAFSLKDGREVLQCTCTDISSLETATLITERAFSDLEIFSQSVRCGLSKHICDNSLTLIWANDYFYKLFGYDKKEYEKMFGESLIPMIYEKDLALVVNSITNLVEDHEIDITFRIKHKTEPFRWVNLIAATDVPIPYNDLMEHADAAVYQAKLAKTAMFYIMTALSVRNITMSGRTIPAITML